MAREILASSAKPPGTLISEEDLQKFND